MSDAVRIIPSSERNPTALDVSLHAMKDGRWEATVYGFMSPMYIYGDTLTDVLLKVTKVVAAKAKP